MNANHSKSIFYDLYDLWKKRSPHIFHVNCERLTVEITKEGGSSTVVYFFFSLLVFLSFCVSSAVQAVDHSAPEYITSRFMFLFRSK